MRKKVVIIIGLPGADLHKIRQRDFSNLPYLDHDSLQKKGNNYDTTNPYTTDTYAHVLEKQKMYTFLNDSASFVYLTADSNADKLLTLSIEAQSVDYDIEVVYVYLSLETALKRKDLSSDALSDSDIAEKHQLMDASMRIIKTFATKFNIINEELWNLSK